MKKILLVTMILIQSAYAPASYLCTGNVCAGDETSLVQVSGLMTVLVTVKSGFDQQVKLITGLARLASGLDAGTTPQPEKKNTDTPQPAVGIVPSAASSGIKYEKTAFLQQGVYAAEHSAAVAASLFISLILMMCFLIIDRRRARHYFYLLARGSIDDYISINTKRVCPLNPSLAAQGQ